MKAAKSLLTILTITTALAVQVQAQSFLTNGLVAYYPFDGNGNDMVNGNNITNSSISLTSDRFGKSNSAVVLSQAMGATNLISVVSSASRTLCEWVKVNNYPGNTTANFGPKPSASFVNFFNSTIIGNNLASDGEFWLDNGYGGLAFFQMPTPTNWSQIVIVYSGRIDTAQIYFNGQIIPLKRSLQEGGDTFGFTYPSQQYVVLNIPNGPGVSGFSTNNFTDDIRVYNRSLSSNEVQQLYAYESQPIVALKQAFKPTFSNLFLGTNYQLQISSNLNSWTNFGVPFTPTNTVQEFTNYFDTDVWGKLFFRLQTAP